MASSVIRPEKELKDFVLRSMVTFSGNKFTEEMMESLIEKLNGIKK